MDSSISTCNKDMRLRGRGRGSNSTPRGASKRGAARGGGGGRGRGGIAGRGRGRGRPPNELRESRDRPDFYSESDDTDYDSDGIISPVSRKKKKLMDFDLMDLDEEEEEQQLSDEASENSDDEEYSTERVRNVTMPDPDLEYVTCPWLELDADMPALELPESSGDILLSSDLLLDALEVYETCRSFYRSIRLSPFLFEDFCAALASVEQSRILAEIHIALLKLSLKDDEDDQIILSVQDMNNSYNIMIQLIEPMTYAEILRQYLESDPARFPSNVLEAVSTGNYPFVDARQRLIVLNWLCDRFLQSAEFKRIVRNEGRIVSEEICRDCGKAGELILCDQCDACYHLQCLELQQIPEGSWLCSICKIHQIKGVTDCLPPSQNLQQQPLCMEPIGLDRHGRRYWFIVRRIFVLDENTNKLYYYTTVPQLYDLISRFDPEELERRLCRVMSELQPEICRQMRTTMELTMEKRGGKRVMLAEDNVARMDEILDAPTIRSKHLPGSLEAEDEEPSALLLKIKTDLGFEDGQLVDGFWYKQTDPNGDLDDKENTEINGDDCVPFYRLGQEISYRRYINYYVENDYAKSPYLRAKERDRVKYLSSKFGLVDDAEWKWPVAKGSRDVYGTAQATALLIRWGIQRLSSNIPVQLMHRLWNKQGLGPFKTILDSASDVESLRDALLRIECSIRKAALNNAWWGTLGHTKLIRATSDDREWWQKRDARKKKEERALVSADANEEYNDIVWVKYAKLGRPPGHDIWRLKDEQYRVNGRGMLGGWLWISHVWNRKWVTIPDRPPLGIDFKTPIEELTSLEAKKASLLDKLIWRLTEVRLNQRRNLVRKWKREQLKNCYSPSCRRSLAYKPICGPDSGLQQCYSLECRQLQAISEEDDRFVETTGVVKAVLRAAVSTQKCGLDKPFPLPIPYGFQTRHSNRRSLFVLPAKVLRRLARQGGMGNELPTGFHKPTKSNIHVWPYACQRPLFDLCWRYLTVQARSLHAVALQLRIFHACVRWAELDPEEEELNVTVHHPDHDEIRTVIGHEELPPDGLTERYKLRVQMVPLDDDDDSTNAGDDDDSEAYREGRTPRGERSSARRRLSIKAKKSNQNKVKATPKIAERWADGVDLRLFEIKRYWLNYEIDNRIMRPPTGLPFRLTPSSNPSPHQNMQYSPAILGRKRLNSTGSAVGQSDQTPRKTTRLVAVGPDGKRYEITGKSEECIRQSNAIQQQPQRVLISTGGDPRLSAGRGGRGPMMGDMRPILPRGAPTSGYQMQQRRGMIPILPRMGSGGAAQMVSTRLTPTISSNLVKISPVPGTSGRTRLMMRRSDGQMVEVNAVKIPPPSHGRQPMDAFDEEEMDQFIDNNGFTGNPGAVRISSSQPSASTAAAPRVFKLAPMGNGAMRASSSGIVASSSVSSVGLRGIRASGSGDAPFSFRQAAAASLVGTPLRMQPGVLRRRTAGDTYAEYYGVESNDRIDPREYQLLAEQGFRPPGRPPGRLSEQFGYGPKSRGVQYNAGRGASSMRPIPGRGSGTITVNSDYSGGDYGDMAKLEPMGQVGAARVRNVVSYRDFNDSKRGGRGPRFEFEENEQEELAIAEAIAREEELMKLEEQREAALARMLAGEDDTELQRIEAEIRMHDTLRRESLEISTRHKRSGVVLASQQRYYPTKTSVLIPPRGDSNDMKICRQLLDGIVTQVCKWDKQFGWSKAHSKKPRDRREYDRQYRLMRRAKRMQQKQMENLLTTRMEEMKREVNKRRTKLEAIAEAETGIPTPWRPSRGRPTKNVKKRLTASAALLNNTSREKFVDPSLISLGQGDVPDESNTPSPPSAKKPSQPKRQIRLVGQQITPQQQQKQRSITPKIQSWKPPKSTPTLVESIRPSLAGKKRKRTDESEENGDFNPHRRPIKREPEVAAAVQSEETLTAPSMLSKIDTTVNHCYCNQPYDKTKFYVGCDICGRWFHGKCIGISEKKSKKISTWLCDNCKGEAETAEKELFCLCRTPYDDTKFYVGCDGCEGWYHPACVGITRQDAELMAEYVCPKCSGTQNAAETGSEDDAASSSRISVPSLNRSDYPFLWRVLESLMEHRASWPFRQPVDAEKHPDYYRLIKNPMDLSTVQRRLEDLEYQRLSDFTSDVCRIFENSRVYNPKDSPIVQCADILEKRFRENLVEARNQADILGGAAGKATEGQMDSFDEEQSERMMPFEEDGTMEEETNLFEDDF